MFASSSFCRVAPVWFTPPLTCISENVHPPASVPELLWWGWVCLCVDRVCPYYLSRSLKQDADVIFMPYNYLVDPKVSQQK